MTAEESEELNESDGTPEQLVNAHRHLVVALAKVYAGRGVAFLDLVEAAEDGLKFAAQRYSGTAGSGFADYATTWIHRAMLV